MSESSTTITIRVPISLKNKLERKRKDKNIALNLLINQVLSKNVQWDEHISNMGWLPFNPSSIKKIFSLLKKQDLEKLGKSVSSDTINGIMFIYGDTKLESVVDFIKSWLESTNTTFRYTESSKSHKFFVTHNLGINWSIFATSASKEFITELGFVVQHIETKKDSYSITIEK